MNKGQCMKENVYWAVISGCRKHCFKDTHLWICLVHPDGQRALIINGDQKEAPPSLRRWNDEFLEDFKKIELC
jgi:hypothetical protein